MSFREGQNSLEVLQEIVSRYLDIESVCLILHEATLNWGQRYDTNNKIISHLDESLIQETPLQQKIFLRQDFLKLKLEDLKATRHQVWSFTSRLKMKDGSAMHLPVMNFHPLNGVTKKNILYFIHLIEPNNEGVLVNSGRYYHYYGDFLLSEKHWLQFNARFLMPKILVSPRYIGHRLQDGYSTLRLTVDDKYKTTIPTVIQIINNSSSAS